MVGSGRSSASHILQQQELRKASSALQFYNSNGSGTTRGRMKKVPPSWLTKGGIVGNLECKGGRGSNPWMEMGWPGSDWGQLKGQLQGGGA